MKKTSSSLFRIVIIVLLIALLLIKFLGIVQMVRIHAGTNDPAIVSGRKVFISSLIHPKRLDFIAYRQDSGNIPSGGQLLLMRLVGVPGDTVEMKEGNLYLNHINADEGMNIKQEYIVPARELLKIDADFYKSHVEEILPFAGDSSDVFLESKQVTQYKINGRRVLYGRPDAAISRQYHQPWNADRFGPVIVPADAYFVLGDNRHHAADSRYTGFVAKKDIVGVVFYGERK